MKKIAWFIPFPTEGSGGHRTILQNMNALIQKGYTCHAYVEDVGGGHSSLELKKIIESHFGSIEAEIFVGFQPEQEYDLIFATAWFTAKFVRDVRHQCKKAYFIQDYEAYFNPMGDGFLLAENSYRYGLMPVTIGKWLSNKMIEDYQTPSNYFDFCADHSVYRKLEHVKREKAICFIYQPEKPRRCSIIGIEALGIVKHLVPDVKIYLYGSRSKTNVWFEHENLELISIEQCNALYNKCMVGLCISSSNPSRIPFEMMASGLPVVDIYRENNLYDMPDGGVLLADQTPESIAKALIELLNDANKREKMSNFGMEYMRDKTLEYGYQQFVNAVDKMFEPEYSGISIIPRSYNQPPVLADVYLQRTSMQISQHLQAERIQEQPGSAYNFLRRVKRKVMRLLSLLGGGA